MPLLPIVAQIRTKHKGIKPPVGKVNTEEGKLLYTWSLYDKRMNSPDMEGIESSLAFL